MLAPRPGMKLQTLFLACALVIPAVAGAEPKPAPKAGDVLLWESWLRHEVTVNRASTSRISVSFNYRL